MRVAGVTSMMLGLPALSSGAKAYAHVEEIRPEAATADLNKLDALALPQPDAA